MPEPARWKATLYRVIFEHDTRAGRAFDVGLIVAILGSVAAVMVDSIHPIQLQYREQLQAIEWGFTLLFTVEYVLRLACVPSRLAYATSFFGVIDLASILPTYLSMIIPGTQYLVVIRVLRVLRVFRILKLVEYVGEANVLLVAIRQSRRKIAIFAATVLTTTVILGAFMYLIEGPVNGFTSIPTSIYWTIVTITTVGYGDIAPVTAAGKMVATVVMLLGYAIVAVPTGILTVELSKARRPPPRTCSRCGKEDHDEDARYCSRCAEPLAAHP